MGQHAPEFLLHPNKILGGTIRFIDCRQPLGIVLIAHRRLCKQIVDGHTIKMRQLRQFGHIRQCGAALPSGNGLSADIQGLRRLLLGELFGNPKPF